MRHLYLSIVLNCLVVLVAMAQPSVKLDDLSWLEGKWNRTNVRADRTAFEQWRRISPDGFTGIGAVLHGSDTISIERLRIIARKDTLYYVADVPENPMPVYFAFTEISPTSFTCENQQHDFPKVIRYVLANGILTATIAGGDKQINFIFKKE